MFRAQAREWGATENLWHTEWGYSTVLPQTGLLARMTIAPSTKQASIANDPGSPDGLGNRCHTFSVPDQQTTVVAFWAAKPWDRNEAKQNSTIQLPLTVIPNHVLLYDLLSGNQTETSWQTSANFSIAIPVQISAAPQLLLIR
jgi:hypothetical protein